MQRCPTYAIKPAGFGSLIAIVALEFWRKKSQEEVGEVARPGGCRYLKEAKTCVFPKLVQAPSVGPSPLRIVAALFEATLQANPGRCY